MKQSVMLVSSILVLNLSALAQHYPTDKCKPIEASGALSVNTSHNQYVQTMLDAHVTNRSSQRVWYYTAFVTKSGQQTKWTNIFNLEAGTDTVISADDSNGDLDESKLYVEAYVCNVN
jgi:hypothetical protein